MLLRASQQRVVVLSDQLAEIAPVSGEGLLTQLLQERDQRRFDGFGTVENEFDSTWLRATLGKGLVFQMVSKTVSTARLEGCDQKEEFLGTKSEASARESRRIAMFWMKSECVEASTLTAENKINPWRSARRGRGREHACTRRRTGAQWR